MDTKYTYSISADFPNHKVDPSRLQLEIRTSAIITAQDYISTAGDACDIFFKADLSVGDKVLLDGIVAAHSGEPLDPAPEYKVDSEGRQIVVQEPNLDGAMINTATHDFCDKTTWWQQSTVVADEVLVDSGDGFTFTSQHGFWIDLTHGKYYLEDRISSSTLPTKVPVVKVDGTVMTVRPPFTPSGGDYTIDYRAGTVTFAASQAGKAVTASYRYAGSSLFTVAPSSGKVLWVLDSEVQFSTDIVMTGTMNFQAWAYDPNNPPNKVPVSSITNYKGLKDFITEAKGVYPLVPAIGGSAGRGLEHSHLVFPFKYNQAKELKSSLGVEIRVWITGDTEYTGEFGNATFYCISLTEET
jgi:hypothetical protein